MDESTRQDAYAQATKTNLLEKLVDGIVGRVISDGGSRTVFGEPVTDGERTIIPVARVTYRFGFGGGSGTGPQIGDDGPAPGGDGGGGGGMLNARPVGYIESDGDGSIFVPVIDWSQIFQTIFTFTGIAMVIAFWGFSRRTGGQE